MIDTNAIPASCCDDCTMDPYGLTNDPSPANGFTLDLPPGNGSSEKESADVERTWMGNKKYALLINHVNLTNRLCSSE
jgi:hypothetical protein